MAQFLKDAFTTFVLALSLWLVGACSGCAPSELAPASAQSPAVTGASVVSLVSPVTRWTWGNLSDEDGLTDNGFKVRYEAYCNAFAISGGRLMTAAHCVTGVDVGGDVKYLSPDGVGYGHATLLSVNKAADLATLEALGLAPLPVTSPPREGADVRAVSSVYEQTHYGNVQSKLAMGFYETSVPIIKGWSGSPVLDSHGRVWGVISQCHLKDGVGPQCDGTGSIVTALQ